MDRYRARLEARFGDRIPVAMGAAALALMAVAAACSSSPTASQAGSGSSSPPAANATTPSAAAAATAAPSSSADASTAVCAGSDVDWRALPPVVQGYGRAWNERDGATRMRLLEEAWADEGSYADPTVGVRVTGRDAFAEHIGGFHEGRAGQYFEPSEWIPTDLHHGYVQMRWRLCGPDHQVVLEGVDFGELDPDGRLRRATGFFALEPELPRPVCAPPIGDWSGIPDVARKWAAASVTDAKTRAALLEEVWAEDGSYVDPSDPYPVVGRAAINERAAGMLWEGAFFEASAWADGDNHHDYLRMRWRLCSEEGPGLEGTDYAELDGDGRLQRVVGFFPYP